MKIELKSELLNMAVLTAIIAVAMPELSFAVPADFKDLAGDLGTKQLSKAPYIVSVIGYVIGSVMMLSGALSLKKHAENPASEALGKGLGRLLVGAAITALPAVLNIMQKTSGVGEQGTVAFKDFGVTF